MNNDIRTNNQDENAIQKPESGLICDLHTKGSAIYLPQQRLLDSKTKEFDNEILKNLPEDTAEEVASVLTGRHRRFSLISCILIFMFLCFCCFLVYWIFPRQGVSQTGEISHDGLLISPFYQHTLNKAIDYGSEYSHIIECLEKTAIEISENKDRVCKNGRLLAVYFDAVRCCPEHSKEIPKKIIDRVVQFDPDKICWQLYRWELYYPECLRYKFSIKDFSYSTEKYNQLIDELKKIETWSHKEGFKKNKRRLELYQARMLFCCWLYSKPKSNMDKNDLGVREREDAYQITKYYTDGDEADIDFAHLRVEIIQAVIDAGIGWGSGEIRAYFDGETFWREDTFINNILKPAQETLEKLQERSKTGK